MAAGLCRILFPVDFSNRCVLAARHVKTWADKLSAVLNTLHVVDPKESGYSEERYYDVISDLVVRRTADLKYFSDHYLGENVAHHTVVRGDARAQIESFARQEKVDLIMLPRTHQSSGSRLLRDSLTATILEKSTASLWITEHVEAVNKLSINRILCAVHFERDLTLDSQNYRILQRVLALAKAFRAEVTFLNVTDKQEEEEEEETTGRPADASSSSGIEPWLIQAREQFGNAAEFLRQKGDVVSAIADITNRKAADLVVVGRTRPGTLGLGVQGHILQIDHAACRPILSVW
jgi:nucleotide-binding universal stress UspA family protein